LISLAIIDSVFVRLAVTRSIHESNPEPPLVCTYNFAFLRAALVLLINLTRLLVQSAIFQS